MGKSAMERVEERAKGFFPGQGHHGFDHTKRVRRLALEIAKGEGADLQIVEAAALLHDIARAREDKGEVKCHAETGANEAKEILEKAGFPREKIGKVQHCIRVHRASKGKKPETLEAAVLQDADRLDVIGATGVARVFHRAGALGIGLYNPKGKTQGVEYSGQRLAAINHLIVKSVNLLKPQKFNTETGKSLAGERHRFLKSFVEQFIAEWEGKK